MTRFTLTALTIALSFHSFSEACDRAYSYAPSYRISHYAPKVYHYAAPRVHRVCPYPMTRETYVLFQEHPILIQRFPQEAQLLEARFAPPANLPASFPTNPPGGPEGPIPFAASTAPGAPALSAAPGGQPQPQFRPAGGPAGPTPDPEAGFPGTAQLAEPLPPADGEVALSP